MTDTFLSADRMAKVMHIWGVQPHHGATLPRPEYKVGNRREGSHLLLGVEPFARHMTSEGHQLQQGLSEAGYALIGKGFELGNTDAMDAVAMEPSTVFVQDKREWSPDCGACLDKTIAFRNVPRLADHPEVFRVTVLKDLLFRRAETWQGHDELRPHAVVHYYHPDLIRALAPWLEHTTLIRTWHSVDQADIPDFTTFKRSGCILSGALNRLVYPLRQRLHDEARAFRLPGVTIMRHPGYGANGCHTPAYLRELSRYKVAICTSSIMGFALRKIIEATACGCRVITDLPAGEVLPEIDGNLIRVSPDAALGELKATIENAVNHWSPADQHFYATAARVRYDYRALYADLAEQIEAARLAYA